MQIEDLKREQYIHIARLGGYLELMESDDTNNDLNRALIKVYAEKHPSCYLGNINFYGDEREALLNGNISCLKEYDGGEVMNFECAFVVPVKDTRLEQMIKHWNTNKAENETINQIFNRVDLLDGLIFIWS